MRRVRRKARGCSLNLEGFNPKDQDASGAQKQSSVARSMVEGAVGRGKGETDSEPSRRPWLLAHVARASSSCAAPWSRPERKLTPQYLLPEMGEGEGRRVAQMLPGARGLSWLPVG